jgi:TRAP-type C4-dicarboxylate transport system permease small subunit
LIYLDSWVVLIGACLAIYGAERIMLDVVRVIARRSRRKPKPSPPPSPIIRP